LLGSATMLMGERDEAWVSSKGGGRAAVVLLGAAFALSTSRAEADGPVSAEPASADPPAPAALPSFMSGKRKLDPYDLSRKTEGDYFTPIPLVDSDPDTGFGLGARVYHYWDGSKADPLYEYTPYRHSLFVQAFATTAGYQDHLIGYDAPYLGNTPYRLRAWLEYEDNIAANYFGRGIGTLGPLTLPGSSTKYTSFDAYTNALNQLRPDRIVPGRNVVFSLYNKYGYEDPSARASVERDLFGGLVRVQAGFTGTYVRITDYSDQTVTATFGQQNVDATEDPTRLHADCLAGTIVGCGGGWNNTLKLGIALDTRDYEPDPNSGVFVDVTAEISNRAFGSAYDYARLTLSPRVFVSPFPKLTDLVLAGRIVYSMQTSGTPFFSQNTLAFTDGDHQGLGGIWTLRGYNQDRFVGAVVAMTNVEIRWTFVSFHWLMGDLIGDQKFSFALVPFLDMGRVFDTVGTFTFADWKRGEGGSFRVAWNQATIVRADFGVSDEGWDFYLDFGHQF
jgi:Omp85 superfamily domain